MRGHRDTEQFVHLLCQLLVQLAIGLPGGSARPAASLGSRLTFIIFCQDARVDNDGWQVQIKDSPAKWQILKIGTVISVYENLSWCKKRLKIEILSLCQILGRRQIGCARPHLCPACHTMSSSPAHAAMRWPAHRRRSPLALNPSHRPHTRPHTPVVRLI